MLQVCRLFRIDAASARLIADDHRRRLGMDRALRTYGKGERRQALAIWDAEVRSDDLGIAVGRSFLVWACDGPAAALRELAREREMVERFARQPAGGKPPGPEWPRVVASLRAAVDMNEAFLAVRTGS